MPMFNVKISKKIEFVTTVHARDADEAKALAWARQPEHVEDWHCEVFDGTKFKTRQVED